MGKKCREQGEREIMSGLCFAFLGFYTVLFMRVFEDFKPAWTLKEALSLCTQNLKINSESAMSSDM